MAIAIDMTLATSSDDLLTGYGAGALLHLERSTTATGSYTEVGSGTAIVSGDDRYTVWDASGTNTSWYRFRVCNVGSSSCSDYADPFQVGLAAYATLDDVKAAMNFGTDSSRDDYLSDLLEDAREYIDGELDRSFARTPAFGDGTFTFRTIRPHRRLSVAMGTPGIDIVSVTTLEVAPQDDGTYTTIAAGAGGYYLTAPTGPSSDWPYGDIELAYVNSSVTFFPAGNATVRLTGVLGFNTVPRLVRRASIDMVREWYRQGAQGGVPSGVNQYGTPLFVQGEPHTMRQLKSMGSPYTNNAVGWVR